MDSMTQRVSKEEFAEWNERMIQEFDPDDYHNHPSPVVRFIEIRRVRALLEHLDAHAGHKVLEVGVGAGNILEKIQGCDLYGIDISDYILEKAKARLGDRATIIKADGEELPFEDNTFDRVYCSEVLEHVINPHQVVAEMRRVAKDDAVVVISVPNEGMINNLKRVVFKTGPIGRFVLQTGEGYESVEDMQDHWHLHEFDKDLIYEVCVENFIVEKIIATPFPGLPLRYVAKLTPR